MNRKNYTYCCSEKPHTVHKVPLHDIKVWACGECTQNHGTHGFLKNKFWPVYSINPETIFQGINE